MNRAKRNTGVFGMHFSSPEQTLNSRQECNQENKQNSLCVDGGCWNGRIQNDCIERSTPANLPLTEVSVSHKVPTTKSVLMDEKHILLVDDEEFVVFSERQMLERYFSYKVTALTSSVEALEAFRERPEFFDLVITDMIMPKMTGEVFAKELLAMRPDIPIILCTGYSECLIKKKAEKMGRAFLMKPFDLYEMGRAIRKVLYRD